MAEQIFTLEEANETLPLIRSITRDVVDHYRAVKVRVQQLGELRDRRKAGEEINADEMRAQDARIGRRLEGLRSLVDEVEALGVRIRDYERGVVDFPAAFVGTGSSDDSLFSFYCWMLGEGEVSHWHQEAEGFQERRPITAEASA